MFSSVAQSCLTFCDSMGCRTPGLPLQHQLPELTQTHVHWVSDAIQPSHPLLSPSPPTFNLSQHQGLFKWVSSSHQVAKVLEFQLQHQSFQWIFRISFKISFKIDWLDLLAVQETFKGLLQHHGSEASILWCSAFFIVHVSHPYMTTGKTVALTRQTFAGKVMSLLFNVLSRFVRAFLPRSKNLLISWLQSPKFVCEVYEFCSFGRHLSWLCVCFVACTYWPFSPHFPWYCCCCCCSLVIKSCPTLLQSHGL